MSITRCLTLAAVLISAPALAQTSPPPMAMPAAASPADKAMSSGMDKMNKDMAAAPMTGNADQDFVAMMLPHHAGAVDMAKVELQYGHDPAMRRLATQIIAAQDKEIAQMHAWQARHPQH